VVSDSVFVGPQGNVAPISRSYGVLLFVIIMLLLSKSKGVTAMLYPQVLGARTKDLVHVTLPCALFPTSISLFGSDS
jgi:hypothetical protein